MKGRCYRCGSFDHRASWHDRDEDTNRYSSGATVDETALVIPADDTEFRYTTTDDEDQDANSESNDSEIEVESPEGKTGEQGNVGVNEPEEDQETRKSEEAEGNQESETFIASDKEKSQGLVPQERPRMLYSEIAKGSPPPEEEGMETMESGRGSDSRKRKLSECEETDKAQDTPQNKILRDESPNEESSMETQTPTPGKDSRTGTREVGMVDPSQEGNNSDSDHTDKIDPGEDRVPYVRGGVQRYRKKRTSWERKPTDESSQETPNQSSQRGRGRGRAK